MQNQRRRDRRQQSQSHEQGVKAVGHRLQGVGLGHQRQAGNRGPERGTDAIGPGTRHASDGQQRNGHQGVERRYGGQRATETDPLDESIGQGTAHPHPSGGAIHGPLQIIDIEIDGQQQRQQGDQASAKRSPPLALDHGIPHQIGPLLNHRPLCHCHQEGHQKGQGAEATALNVIRSAGGVAGLEETFHQHVDGIGLALAVIIAAPIAANRL